MRNQNFRKQSPFYRSLPIASINHHTRAYTIILLFQRRTFAMAEVLPAELVKRKYIYARQSPYARPAEMHCYVLESNIGKSSELKL